MSTESNSSAKRDSENTSRNKHDGSIFSFDSIKPINRRGANLPKINPYYLPVEVDKNIVELELTKEDAQESKRKTKNKFSFLSLFKKRKSLALKTQKKLKARLKLSTLIVLVCLVVNGGFWGTIAAQEVKSKIDVLRLFSQGKYLVLFQNNAEMRPSGGFIGSFAVVEFNDYKVKNINFNTNIYKIDNNYTENHIVTPPEPLKDISNGRWAMHDANFAVDFPTAAQQVKWFYEQETSDRADGVIVVNASVIRDLLGKVGSIEMPDYKATVGYDNFFEELAQKVEKDYFTDDKSYKANEPKSILKDMMPIVFEKAMHQSKVELLKLAYKSLTEKQILFYSDNTNIEKAILDQNWGGKIMEANKDYLHINMANITGGKSSLSVKEKIDYRVKEDKSGRLLGELLVTRSHAGTGVFPDGTNHNWARVLVPAGSELSLIEIDGKDILDETKVSQEAGKTVFGFWLQTKPQTSTMLKINYLLPFDKNNYNLIIQKQPGNLGDNLTVSFGSNILFDGILDQDKEISVK